MWSTAMVPNLSGLVDWRGGGQGMALCEWQVHERAHLHLCKRPLLPQMELHMRVPTAHISGAVHMYKRLSPTCVPHF